MDPATDSQACRLLTLPSELRNKTYRYAVVESDIFIPMESLPPTQPGLLQVSQQLRHETLSIYYRENDFCWEIRDLDAAGYIRWAQSSQHRRDARTSWLLQGGRNWKNLAVWLSAYYNDAVKGPLVASPETHQDNMHPIDGVVFTFFMALAKCKFQELTWAQAEDRLTDMYDVLIAADKQWKQEADSS